MQVSEKQSLRRELSERRLGMSVADAEAAAQAAAAHLLGLEEVAGSSALGIYWPHRGELSTEPLFEALRRAGKEVFLPRIDPVGDRLLFSPLDDESELVAGPFGVLEPRGDSHCEAADLPALVIPGLAFDRSGGRLGWGKGYYDRALRNYSGHRLGYAFEFQIVETLPCEEHDEGVEVLVTEAGVIKVGTGGRS